MSSWIVGEVARCSVKISDPATNLPADPGSVAFKVKSPSGSTITYAYPGAITRIGVGEFRCDVDLTEKGKWLYRWETDTPYKSASQGYLTVASSNI